MKPLPRISIRDLELAFHTVDDNTCGLIHPSTRARQSRTLLSSFLSLHHRSKLPLPTLEHPTRRSSIHAGSASRQAITFARARRTTVVAASVEDANLRHFSKASTVAAIVAQLGAFVDGIADVGSLHISTAGAQAIATLTRAGVCWNFLVG